MSNKLGLGGLKKKTEAEFIAEVRRPFIVSRMHRSRRIL